MSGCLTCEYENVYDTEEPCSICFQFSKYAPKKGTDS